MRIAPLPATLFTLFAFSGFSGLIYESVWSHYLKLFLGHAAYAQTLVLAIFMGGLAFGSLLANRWNAVSRSPLVTYALIEGLIGLCGLGFDRVFREFTELSFEHVIPSLQDGTTIQAYKWAASAAIILPQSVLLGMTFPLMSIGLIRCWPETPGSHLSMLYFTNSLGAAAGVLASGFVLIPEVGLPGAIMTAGIINILVGLSTWIASRRFYHEPATSLVGARAEDAGGGGAHYPTLLLASLVTGFASFLYEIGWIRMLTLVLGASTHAFELMLSAFILGLAFGGLWIRRRIEAFADPLATLGVVQVVMAFLALATLMVYGKTFDLMGTAMSMFARNDAGYLGFNVSSHLIAILLMVPTTFCAGMTLPLLTYTALKRGVGERAIGGIYAANTVGAILGVAVAVHVAMPATGTRGVVVAGAVCDFMLGLWLLSLGVSRRRPLYVACALGLGGLGLVLASDFNPQKLVSGVFRTGKANSGAEVLFHQDGKTATVSLMQDGRRIMLASNGKIDASITSAEDKPSHDEITQNMSGALPLALHPGARTAAVIGFGSGMTSAILLGNPQLERLDTIEIEPLIIEAARKGMMPRNRAAYEDPRSMLHVEDAKTFLSTHRRRYDIIVSEPSNPWVSGVASLFTEEFYRHAVRYLEKDGLLVQWIQIYEMDFRLVASIMRAMSSVFEDFEVYNVDLANMLIVARTSGKPIVPSQKFFESGVIAAELKRVGILAAEDMAQRRIAGKRLLDPLIELQGVPKNSDYFPFVDVNAVRARFKGDNAKEFAELSLSDLPVAGFLERRPRQPVESKVGRESYDTAAQKANLIRAAVLSGATDILPPSVSTAAILLYAPAGCPGAKLGQAWEMALLKTLAPLAGHLQPSAMADVWERILPDRCTPGLTAIQRNVVDLLKAVSLRDGAAMAESASALMTAGWGAGDAGAEQYLLGAYALGTIATDRPGEALSALDAYLRTQSGQGRRPALQTVWLYAIAADQARPKPGRAQVRDKL